MLAELVRGSEDSQGRKYAARKALPGNNFSTISFGTTSGASVLVTSLIYVYSFRIPERIQPGFLSYQTENTFTEESR